MKLKNLQMKRAAKPKPTNFPKNAPTNPSTTTTMSNVTNQRYVTLGDRPCAARFGPIAGPQRYSPRVSFSEFENGADGTHHVAEGYNTGI
jgi:hypothetical protein